MTTSKKQPIGRTTRMSFYSPGGEAPSTFPDGTWIEAESFAYPGDTFTRRAYATFPDGSRRVVRCKVADTYSTVPARARIGKQTVRGFLTCDEMGVRFNHEKTNA